MRYSCLATALLGVAPLAAQSLPLGDGHVTDHPATGNVYACQTQFRGGGAMHDGPWFHGQTWNPAEKPHVAGRVMWPDAAFSIRSERGDLAVETNGLPVNEPTGTFPISRSDTVFQYDRNPNAIRKHQLSFAIPLAPVPATAPSCVPMGMIGFTTTGVAIYNALDAAGRDAAAHEIQDLCNGHPQGAGQYHYHSSSPCLPGAESDSLVGWALDGYPILGMRGGTGALITNADLDACHGREERITVDGRSYAYAYRLTREYPYTLSCYHGEVSRETMQAIHQSMGPPPGRRRRGEP